LSHLLHFNPDVDEVEYELAPKDKRPRLPSSGHNSMGIGNMSGGEDTGAEADNEKSEYETEDQASLTGMVSQEEMEGELPQDADVESTSQLMTAGGPKVLPPSSSTGAGSTMSAPGASGGTSAPKRKKLLVARPFGMMRGHTAFLTFATAGNKKQPNPNEI
jgi:hypothetical protein